MSEQPNFARGDGWALFHGEVYTLWRVDLLKEFAAYYRRLTAAPDPTTAEYYRAEADWAEAVIRHLES